MARVLVCGGRGFSGSHVIFSELDKLKSVDLVIHGGASGADRIAGKWAEARGIPCMCFPAPWRHYGNHAGPIRNGWMLDLGKPDLVMAFPGGRGTADMVRRAEEHGVPVVKISERGE